MKGQTSACAKTARGPAEMLIVNKVLGFHSNPPVGRTAAPLASAALRARAQPLVYSQNTRVRERQKERKQTDKRFLQGSRSAPLNICYQINEVMLSRRRSGEGSSEAAEGSPPLEGTLFSHGQPKYPNLNRQTRALPHGTGNKMTLF